MIAWAITAAVVVVVDPVLADAAWWDYDGSGLLGALAFPLGLWIVLSAGLGFLSSLTDARTAHVLLALAVVASSAIVTVTWTLLLSDAFPSSQAAPLGLPIAAGAVVLFAATAAVSAVRNRRRASRA
ncbi:hypothetical protein J4G33_14900 [Actinotalea sp. BY-33]|uniref:Uncharacterized protein n=1 Tax=Actinotalea soli TaxID=2819234 RepID=A0A939RT03_9CELL|nr:hypothetical protein [Actinotalea soli]MBO1753097.1 hypothetical protein [Actinotalea soli]